MRIVFKNLEKSELAKEAVNERLGDMVEKFPKLKDHKITVTLSMENSPIQAGPDSFSVRLLVRGKEFREVALTKKASSLYVALAELREHLLETLNRTTDRERVKQRTKERRFRFAM